MFTPNKDSNPTEVKSVPINPSRDKKDAASDLNGTANTMGRKVRNLYSAARKEIGDDMDVVASQIRKKPVQSSVIALGVGVLLGALFRRT